jgi:hypothetical protein
LSEKERDMSSFDRDFNRTKNGIFGMGCFIVIINIIIFVAVIAGIIAGCNYVRKNGLKGAVDAVWNGDTNNVEQVTE